MTPDIVPWHFTRVQIPWSRATPTPLYDLNARRKTVSITLNADLATKAAAAGINLSRTAEDAIDKIFIELERARIREELREAAAFTAEYVARHGHPFADWAADFTPESGTDDAASRVPKS